jgi:predicted transcriptional regulator
MKRPDRTHGTPVGDFPTGSGEGNRGIPSVTTPLGQRLANRGYTLTSFAKEIGVSKADMSNFAHGKSDRVGAAKAEAIHQALKFLDVKITAGFSIHGR